jgi:16S rRNA (guanine527-N7)-methyltransferase
MLTRHILDSLVVVPYINGDYILDVGSGAGLPGIPLAIVLPEKKFVLLDSNSKKTRFMTQAVAELGLENVDVVCSRIESFKPGSRFDVVISRAFSSIAEMVNNVGALVKKEGKILAMKGAYPVAELDQVPGQFRVEKIDALKVPGLDAERHLVIIGAKD